LSLAYPLVTGAGGFVGSHLVRKLSQNSDTKVIYAVDLDSSERLLELASLPKVQILKLDLRNPKSTALLPDLVSAVFALAALNGTSRFYTMPWTVLEASTLPTLLVIRKYSGKAPIVYSSSSEVYASSVEAGIAPVPTGENVLLSIEDIHNPRWSYAMAKMHGEAAMVAAAIELGLNGSIVRYHNVYGPDMGVDHFIPDFVGRVVLGQAEIHGGENTRSFLHINDAVTGTLLALKKASPDVPVFHLGTQDELTIENAARIILKVMDRENLQLNILPGPSGSVSRRCPDTSKAQQVLGWQPKITFEDGIKTVVEEYLK
jgi:nucleoside-diphosphate-sugar epimerase